MSQAVNSRLLKMINARQIFVAGLFALLLGACDASDSVEPGSSRIDEHGIEQLWVPAGTYLRGIAELAGRSGPAMTGREQRAKSLARKLQ
jgi:hypothetical protein